MKLKNLELHLRKIVVDPERLSALESALTNVSAKYPIAHSKLKKSTIPLGVTLHTVPHLLRGKLPRHLIFCFQTEEAHGGSLKTNGYKFTHFNIDYLNIFVNGEPIVQNGLRLNFETGAAIKGYSWMLNNIGLKNSISVGLSLEDFVENSTIFPFDLTADLNNNVYPHGIIQGQIDVHIGFKKTTTSQIAMMTYATYDEIIEIDKDRNITIIQ
jgi:hypothetical protein